MTAHGTAAAIQTTITGGQKLAPISGWILSMAGRINGLPHPHLCLFLIGCLLLPAACTITSPGQEKYSEIPHTYAIEDPQFQRSLDGLLGESMVPGNKIETLVNGDQIFPAMLQAIRTAQASINFETFIYWDGQIGTQL